MRPTRLPSAGRFVLTGRRGRSVVSSVTVANLRMVSRRAHLMPREFESSSCEKIDHDRMKGLRLFEREIVSGIFFRDIIALRK
jgi:hypothetical protein